MIITHAVPGRSLGGRPGRWRRVTGLSIGALLLATAWPVEAGRPEIVTWVGNEAIWNERLGVTLLRQGCSAAPDECLRRLRASAREQGIDRFALAVKRGAGAWPEEALEYSRRSLTEPLLVEVDIDDFVSTLKRWHRSTLGQGNRVITEVAANLKRHNPGLRFGITLYEDEVDSRFVALIPAETRERVDRVSLYLHYRANAVDYARFVAAARRQFPRAAIWAGSYAYDRIDYFPCSPTVRLPCSVTEEIDLYRDSLRTQLDMLRTGSIDGIEFYPGLFGREDQWHGWTLEHLCRPERRLECIENTRRMRAVVAAEFATHRPDAAPADRTDQ